VLYFELRGVGQGEPRADAAATYPGPPS